MSKKGKGSWVSKRDGMLKINVNNEDCFCCGASPLTLFTLAPQDPDYPFVACDGDSVVCLECTYRHYFSVNADYGLDLCAHDDDPWNWTVWKNQHREEETSNTLS